MLHSVPFAAGVIAILTLKASKQHSPGSAESPWRRSATLGSYFKTQHNPERVAQRCRTLTGFMCLLTFQPRVRLAALGYDVEPRCGSRSRDR